MDFSDFFAALNVLLLFFRDFFAVLNGLLLFLGVFLLFLMVFCGF